MPTTFEFFPKQDGIQPSDPHSLGNLIKLPLAVHPLTGRKAEIVVAPAQIVPARAQVVYGILSALSARETRRKVAEPIPDIIPETKRNTTLTSLAGSMRHRGMTQSEIEVALLAVNGERCRPALPEKEVKGIAASVARYTPDTTQATSSSEGRKSKAASRATELVHLAEARYKFLTDSKGRPFAFPHGGPYIARPLRGGKFSLRAEMAATYAELHDSVPREGDLTDSIRVLEGKAMRTTCDLHLRVARHGRDILLDLGRSDGKVVVVTPGSWSVTPGIPEVVFERTELTSELPVPERGGDLSELRALLNVTDKDWPLVVAWLGAALFPDIPHTILLFRGEPGVAKTWAARLLVRLIDPSPAELCGPPKDLETWVVTAAASHVVGLDNLRHVEDWLSDALCRAATGEGGKRRRLYQDDAVAVFRFLRCIILTSIAATGLGEDLGDRLLTIELLAIPDERRLLDSDIEERFRAEHPRLLGALLDLLCQVLEELSQVDRGGWPRMAEFARVLAALDRVTGWQGSEQYANAREDIITELLEGDPVARAVIRLVEQQTELRDGKIVDGYQLWESTPTQLLSELNRLTLDRPSRGWPTVANHLVGRLKRLAPALRHVGITITTGREGKGSPKYVRLTRFDRRPHGTDADAPAGPAATPPPPPADVQPEDDEEVEWS